jgi:hypothetical protein
VDDHLAAPRYSVSCLELIPVEDCRLDDVAELDVPLAVQIGGLLVNEGRVADHLAPEVENLRLVAGHQAFDAGCRETTVSGGELFCGQCHQCVSST